MTNLKTILAVGVLSVGLAACSSTRTVGSQFSDAEITSKVKAKLAADPELHNLMSVDVDTNERVVRLSGRVETDEQSREAEKLAAQTDGVIDVDNDLAIGQSRTFGQSVDDSVITTKVKSKLAADGDINPFNIDVDTRNGIVTLTGRVNNTTEKKEAEQIAIGTDGVQKVENRLAVGDLDDADANAHDAHHR